MKSPQAALRHSFYVRALKLSFIGEKIQVQARLQNPVGQWQAVFHRGVQPVQVRLQEQDFGSYFDEGEQTDQERAS